MKVVDARVRWMEGYVNDPCLEILVDKLPADREYVFERRGSLYFAEAGGAVRFFSWRGGQGEGYGGTWFQIRLLDTETGVIDEDFVLKGPWSSRAGCMNAVGFTPSVDVSITDDPEAFRRGHTFLAGHVTLELALAAATKAGCQLVRVDDCGEPRWVPSIQAGRVVRPEGEADLSKRTPQESPDVFRKEGG